MWALVQGILASHIILDSPRFVVGDFAPHAGFSKVRILCNQRLFARLPPGYSFATVLKLGVRIASVSSLTHFRNLCNGFKSQGLAFGRAKRLNLESLWKHCTVPSSRVGPQMSRGVIFSTSWTPKRLWGLYHWGKALWCFRIPLPSFSFDFVLCRKGLELFCHSSACFAGADYIYMYTSYCPFGVYLKTIWSLAQIT